MSIVEKPKGEPFDNGPKDSSGQYERYAVLPQADRDKGFIRPYRDTYLHLKCNTTTHMGYALSATYARDPKYYGATFCCSCHEHFPVSEFVWEDGEVLGS